MKKIIIKTALSTLGIVAGCAVIVFAILSLGFPGTLCGWCEQLGNYGFAVRYASLYYSYTGDVADLARCVEDSILSENDGDITEYCAKLVDDEEFESYCALRDEEINGSIAGDDDFQDITFSYRQYVYGWLAGAHYRGGNTELALGCAIEALDSGFDREDFTSVGVCDYTISKFPPGNALGSLSLSVIEKGDKASGDMLLTVLESASAADEAEKLYLDTLKGALKALSE